MKRKMVVPGAMGDSCRVYCHEGMKPTGILESQGRVLMPSGLMSRGASWPALQ